MSYNVKKIKLDFPMLQQKMNGKPFIYFDNAATTQKPQSVVDAIVNFYTKEYATVHRAVYEFATIATDNYCDVRRKMAQFIKAKREDEIVFTRGTTESINIIASAYGKEFVYRGDEILITEMEHHANIVPWQLLCEEVGAKLIVAPITQAGEIDLVEFKKRLSSKTKIVSICHISNVLGTVNPVKEIAKMVHERGAILVVDGAQAAPRLPIDVQDLDVDFYAFSGHKLYGPTGIGVLYGKMDLLEKMRPYHGGGDMIKEVTFAKTIFHSPPLKFEAGTPIIAQVIGLGAALDYLQKLQINKIQEHEEELLAYATQKFQERENIRVFGKAKHKSAIISFYVEGVHPLDIGTMISFKGIAIRTGTLCAQPCIRRFGCQTVCRISFGIYNTKEEIDSFFKALDEVVAQLTPVMA